MKEYSLNPISKCPYLGISIEDVNNETEILIIKNWYDSVSEKKSDLKHRIKELNAQIDAGIVKHSSGKLVSARASYSALFFFERLLKKKYKELEVLKNKSSNNRHYYFIKTFYSVARDFLDKESFDKICKRANEIVDSEINNL